MHNSISDSTSSLDAPPSKIRAPLGCGCLLIASVLAVAFLRPHTTTRDGGKKGRGDRVVPVQVAEVHRQDVPVEVQGVGSVTPYSTVPVTAQVSGQLKRVLFRQGEYVTQGQPLFEIDSRVQQASAAQSQAALSRDSANTSQSQAIVSKDRALIEQAKANLQRDQAAVSQAEANLARDLAQFEFLQKQAQRYRDLVSHGYVTVEQAQQQITNATSFAGTIEADRAAVASAKSILEADRAAVAGTEATLRADMAVVQGTQATFQADAALFEATQVQLDFTSIRSPLTGRTGTLNIHEGTVVRANDVNPLVTIYQVEPIYVTFAVPEKYLQEIQTGMKSHSLTVNVTRGSRQMNSGSDASKGKEQLKLDSSSDLGDVGRVTFVENTIDPTTGTITLRASFPNRYRHLWPGQFVNVNLLLKEQKRALVVPSTAVQPGQKGDYVFVLKSDDTVESRPVKVDFIYHDESIIASGLSEGEKVVTDGQLELKTGTKVKISTGLQPSGSPSPSEGNSGDGNKGKGRRRSKRADSRVPLAPIRFKAIHHRPSASAPNN
jgi:membrane fusion protein, multidrug efflux system